MTSPTSAFGEGIEPDAYGVRKLASTLETLFIAASCSKNFGLYRERRRHRAHHRQRCPHRRCPAQPPRRPPAARWSPCRPDHGAACVAEILGDSALYADWVKELDEVSAYIRLRRQQLADALNRHGGDWNFITRSHRGMFTLLPLGKERVERLRNDYAVYMVGEGRINIAG